MPGAEIEALQATYSAFERGDLEATLRNFHEDIDWIEPEGYFPSARGEHRGVESVRRILHSYADYWDRFDVQPVEYVDVGDGRILVIGTARFRANGSDETYAARLVNLWTMRDAKAARLEVFNDTALVWKALGGRPDYFD